MKVSVIPMDIVWGDPAKNIEQAQQLIQQTDVSDLYVLPEMWATGFATKPEGIAEDEKKSEALQWMRDFAAVNHAAICGSLAIRTSDGIYRNRHYFVTPDNVVFYDKHHLFTHGHEDLFFTPGEHAVIAQWQGFRFLLQTCYDLRFPVFSRYGIAGEYDAIIYVANWPSSRQLAWDTLIRARAIENQSYVIAVNRIGFDPVTHYDGGSAIISPLGKTAEGLTAELSLDALGQMRDRFRVLDDRDQLTL